MFSKYDVLSERELEARYEVLVEQYVTKLNIEAETAAMIARTQLLPAAIQHLGRLNAAGDGAGIAKLTSEANVMVDRLIAAIDALDVANEGHPEGIPPIDEAIYVRDSVVPAMDEVRGAADALECIVSDDLWPLPKYSEILFIK